MKRQSLTTIRLRSMGMVRHAGMLLIAGIVLFSGMVLAGCGKDKDNSDIFCVLYAIISLLIRLSGAFISHTEYVRMR